MNKSECSPIDWKIFFPNQVFIENNVCLYIYNHPRPFQSTTQLPSKDPVSSVFTVPATLVSPSLNSLTLLLPSIGWCPTTSEDMGITKEPPPLTFP